MICGKCGFEFEGNFCPKCGTAANPPDEFNTDTEIVPASRKKVRKKKILIAAIVICVFSAGGAGVYFSFFTPEKQFEKMIRNEDYNSAKAYYDSHFTKDPENAAVISAINSTIESIVQRFNENKIDKATADEKVNMFLAFNISSVNDNVSDARRHIETLYSSKISYSEGLTYSEAGMYLEAVLSFRQVLEDDVNYPVAQENIDSAVNSYSEAKIVESDKIASTGKTDDLLKAAKYLKKEMEKAENFPPLIAKFDEYINVYKSDMLELAETQSKNDYYIAMKTLSTAMEEAGEDGIIEKYNEYSEKYVDNAILRAEQASNAGESVDILATALKHVPDSEKLLSADEKYKDAYVAETIKKADSCSSYSEKISIYKTALIKMPDSEKLTSAKQKAEDQYAQEISEDARYYFNNKNYDYALSLILDAFDIVPNNSVLTLLYNELSSSIPHMLNDLNYLYLYDCNEYFKTYNSSESLVDNYGNYYYGPYLSTLTTMSLGWFLWDSGYCEYYCGSYTRLKGTVALASYDGNTSNNPIYFYIYADGNLIDKIYFDTYTKPVDIDIDISDTWYLTFKIGAAGDMTAERIIMSDFAFYE